MTIRPDSVSVLDPISPAFNRVKTVLFSPFDLKKWFVIGFCAWLAHLNKGDGPNLNFGRQGPHGVPLDETLYQAKEYILGNLHWIIPLIVFGVIALMVLWLVITWLSSRGKFMFLHCVAENKSEVKIPWSKFRAHANSLFLFRIVVGIISLLVVALFCMLIFLLALSLINKVVPNIFSVTAILLSTLVFITLVAVFILVLKFTTDFVVSIMYLRTAKCVDAWREFLHLLSTNKGRFVLYILFQIVISIAISAIILAAACVTCCCAACILAIPYIGVVLMLPLVVFKRAYSLYYFRQFGPEFDVFVTEIEPAPSL